MAGGYGYAQMAAAEDSTPVLPLVGLGALAVLGCAALLLRPARRD
ncbi:hypothetical protein AB0I60_27050 [Actinosynnema sp. NPDC050436]